MHSPFPAATGAGIGLPVVVVEVGLIEVGLGFGGKGVGRVMGWNGGRVKDPSVGDMVKTPGGVDPLVVVGLIVGRVGRVGRPGRPGRTGLNGRFGRFVVVKINGGRVSKGVIVDGVVTAADVTGNRELGGVAVVICVVVE